MEIKVQPEKLRELASTLQDSLNQYSKLDIVKDETSTYKGNDTAAKYIDDALQIADDFKGTLSTFVNTLNDFATTFEEKDKNI